MKPPQTCPGPVRAAGPASWASAYRRTDTPRTGAPRTDAARLAVSGRRARRGRLSGRKQGPAVHAARHRVPALHILRASRRGRAAPAARRDADAPCHGLTAPAGPGRVGPSRTRRWETPRASLRTPAGWAARRRSARFRVPRGGPAGPARGPAQPAPALRGRGEEMRMRREWPGRGDCRVSLSCAPPSRSAWDTLSISCRYTVVYPRTVCNRLADCRPPKGEREGEGREREGGRGRERERERRERVREKERVVERVIERAREGKRERGERERGERERGDR